VSSTASSERRAAGPLLLAAAALAACAQAPTQESAPAAEVAGCRLAPPPGPFQAATQQSTSPPSTQNLPADASGSWATLIAPGAQHRWTAKTGLVESADGSLRLEGVATTPGQPRTRLHVLVLVDYAPATAATISFWSGDREERLGDARAARANAEAEGQGIAFDIELPAETVPPGSYREIQTLVWPENGHFDARRWTVYAGPEPPDPVGCVAAAMAIPEIPGRTVLDPGGRFLVRAPRVATLGVVPVRQDGIGDPLFLSIDTAKKGWDGKLGAGIEFAAVWEAPFTGPARNWISSFWSVRPQTIPDSVLDRL
jgi:hypothetical protein